MSQVFLLLFFLAQSTNGISSPIQTKILQISASESACEDCVSGYVHSQRWCSVAEAGQFQVRSVSVDLANIEATIHHEQSRRCL